MSDINGFHKSCDWSQLWEVWKTRQKWNWELQRTFFFFKCIKLRLLLNTKLRYIVCTLTHSHTYTHTHTHTHTHTNTINESIKVCLGQLVSSLTSSALLFLPTLTFSHHFCLHLCFSIQFSPFTGFISFSHWCKKKKVSENVH